MNPEELRSHQKIGPLLHELEELGPDLILSDVIEERDGKRLQYVDLVMEGGGVLGVALVGYIYALETAGLRFLSIGGTSAGSIVALLLAALAEKHEAKSARLCEILFSMNIADFIDGDSDAADMSHYLGSGEWPQRWFKGAFKAAQVLDNLRDDYGLNPGKKFQDWLHAQLKAAGTATTDLLVKRIQKNPAGLQHRETGRSLQQLPCELKIVAADITTETKAVFPEMAPMYWRNTAALSPSYYVRASMSIPLFFHPLRARGIRRIPGVQAAWKERGRYRHTPPDEVLFADGGIMSNFPISLFHDYSKVPVAPTFGIKLGATRQAHKTDGFLAYTMALLESMQHYADLDFLFRNPDYRALVGRIDTGNHNWLNFRMSGAQKLDLFYRGALAARDFLKAFAWQPYKKLRKNLISATAG
ncbi:MAG: patatin-like phospholipase family protein [Spirochaetales bacterium]|nr:patatin-like phospholipase family protein [Spirochaetales bacterium]